MILDRNNPEHLHAVADLMAELFPDACGAGSFESVLRERAASLDRSDWELLVLHMSGGARNVVPFRGNGA